MPLVKLVATSSAGRKSRSGLHHSYGLAVELDSGEQFVLRHGRGILFAQGIREGDHGVRLPRGFDEASICSTVDGRFAVLAVRVDPSTGRADALVLTRFTRDGRFQSVVLDRLAAEDAHAPTVSASGEGFTISWRERGETHLVALNTDLEVTRPPVVTRWEISTANTAHSAQISTACADALIAQLGDVSLDREDGALGAFTALRGRADPAIGRWNDRWLFVATDEHLASRRSSSGLLLRDATAIDHLPDARDHLILGHDSTLQGCFWAPELHVIGSKLWCFFAPSVGTTEWHGVQAWAMWLTGDSDPTNAVSWSQPEPVVDRSGGPLQLSQDRPGISLDMTYFEVQGRSYLAWSQRFTTPYLGDAEIWIAETTAANPTRLITDAVRIVVPEFSWEIDNANVVEAPFVVVHGGLVYMTYSASAVGPTYAVGLVTAAENANLLDPQSWTKTPYPLLDANPSRNEWGPGHSMFVRTDDDTYYLAYHALRSETERVRESRLRRVLFGASGRLVLDADYPDDDQREAAR